MKKQKIISFVIVFFCVIAVTGYVTQVEGKTMESALLKGIVQDISGNPIADATVFIIPATDVEAMAKTTPEIKKDSLNDEILEDNLAANRDKYRKAKTGKKGNFAIPNVAEGKYFVYVEPSDKSYLPGGDKSNKAISAAETKGKEIKILLSGNVPPDTAYVGSSKCLACHKAYMSQMKTLHKLGITVVGKPGKLQDHSRFPGFNKGLHKLAAGAKLYFYNFDKTRGFDKYLISEKMPSDPASVSFMATFFKDADGKLKFRAENMKDAADPVRTYTVEMTYGGGLYKQRYLYRVGKNLFPFVQYNTEADNAYNDRARKEWRDYHGDWLFNEGTKKLTDPPQGKSFDKECASCHFTGYTLAKIETGEYIAGAVNDPSGEADIDGDGIPNELNIGCETCHGPGAAHIKASKAKKASTIVSPGKLAPGRASVICGQCHSRPQGNLKNDQPVNKDNKMMIPGTSRNDFLVNYTTREDAAKGDFWADGIHSKSHHQQYTDFIKSKKYRNSSYILKCSDCHDPHGSKPIKHQLRAEVRDDKNSLCAGCHTENAMDIKKHQQAKMGVDMGSIYCVDCHATKTAQTGAGLGKGLTGKDGKNYWVNDITSHLFDVPRKTNPGVKGVESGKAMPIPYTNTCGKCHDVANL